MRNKKGFTLIELLIVIALLGILAVGLLASIDPFEQLRKGRDTSGRNSAEQLQAAAVRYYGSHGNFPWTSSGVAIPAGMSSVATTGYNGTVLQGVISELTNAGELKQNFYTLAGSSSMARMTVVYPASEQFITCFQPESKGFRSDQSARYDQTGGISASCPNATSAACYICFQ